MDRKTMSEDEFWEENANPERLSPSRTKWKKKKTFGRKSRKPSRPTSYMGQRSNSHPRSGL